MAAGMRKPWPYGPKPTQVSKCQSIDWDLGTSNLFTLFFFKHLSQSTVCQRFWPYLNLYHYHDCLFCFVWRQSNVLKLIPVNTLKKWNAPNQQRYLRLTFLRVVVFGRHNTSILHEIIIMIMSMSEFECFLNHGHIKNVITLQYLIEKSASKIVLLLMS